MTQHVAIEKDKAQAILNYLANRPYVEVKDLVPALVGAQIVEVKEAEKPEELETK